MTENSSPVPFGRLADEPAADFALLLAHRDAGPGRSLRATAKLTGKSESTLRRLSTRWDWALRLTAYDDAVLAQLAALGAEDAVQWHRAQLEQFRRTQQSRAEQLSLVATQMMKLVLSSAQQHQEEGTMLAPRELAAAITAASRAIEAASNTAATALGVDRLLADLDADDN